MFGTSPANSRGNTEQTSSGVQADGTACGLWGTLQDEDRPALEILPVDRINAAPHLPKNTFLPLRNEFSLPPSKLDAFLAEKTWPSPKPDALYLVPQATDNMLSGRGLVELEKTWMCLLAEMHTIVHVKHDGGSTWGFVLSCSREAVILVRVQYESYGQLRCVGFQLRRRHGSSCVSRASTIPPSLTSSMCLHRCARLVLILRRIGGSCCWNVFDGDRTAY